MINENDKVVEFSYVPNVIKEIISKNITEDKINVILSILDDDVKFYIRISGSIKSNNILVFYNGAVDLSKKKEKEYVFQRSSWDRDFDALVINVDDATARLASDIVIGWGQGNLDKYYSSYYNKYIQDILASLPSVNLNKLHIGSSAGGYQAIVGASYDIGSRAIVFNPQIDWSHHFYLGHSDRLRNISFKGYSFESLRSMYPYRLNCILMAIKLGNIPSIDYYVNTAFSHDVDNQLIHFVKSLYGQTDLLIKKEINISMYSNIVLGHNPPMKDDTIKYIKKRMV